MTKRGRKPKSVALDNATVKTLVIKQGKKTVETIQLETRGRKLDKNSTRQKRLRLWEAKKKLGVFHKGRPTKKEQTIVRNRLRSRYEALQEA